jgi:hypothetical protein
MSAELAISISSVTVEICADVTGNLSGAKTARKHLIYYYNWYSGCLNRAKRSGPIGSIGLVYRVYRVYRVH